jgi:WD40 repeat protein
MLSHDGRKVLTASEDGTARLWDADTGRELLVLRHKDEVWGAFLSRDGRKVLTLSPDRLDIDQQKITVKRFLAARIWDAETGRELWASPSGGALRMALLSPDGQKIAVALEDGTARVLDTANGKELSVLRGHEGAVSNAKFSSDGQKIVTVSEDQTARLWDAAAGTQLAILRVPEGAISGAEFGPDGKILLTTSTDRTARVWDAATGAALAVLRGHEGQVWSRGFSQDGAKLLTISERTARLWSLPTYRSLDELVVYAKALALPPLSEVQCREFGILPERCAWPPP